MKPNEDWALSAVTEVKTEYWIFEHERCLLLYRNMEAKHVDIFLNTTPSCSKVQQIIFYLKTKCRTTNMRVV